QQPRMLPHGQHHVFRPQQSHTVSVRLPRNLLRQLGQRDVDVDSRRSYRNYSGNLLTNNTSWLENFIDESLIDNSSLCVNSVLLASLQELRGVPRPDNTRYPHLTRNNRRMTSRAAIFCNDRAGDLHAGNPVRVRHSINENILVFHHPPSILQTYHNLSASRMKTWTSRKALNHDNTIKHRTFSRL